MVLGIQGSRGLQGANLSGSALERLFLPPPPRGGAHSYSDSLLDLEALGHFSILCLKIAFIFLPSDPRSETRLCSTLVRRGM